MQNKTKLLIGILLPVLVILFVVISVVVPKAFFHPKYDFLYTVDPYCTNYDCRYPGYGYSAWAPYKIVNGKLIKETSTPTYIIPTPPGEQKTGIQVVYPKIYRYSVTADAFSEVSLDDAQNVTLTDSGSAPDGTVIVNESRGGGLVDDILGGGRNNSELYLKNGSLSKKIIVQNAGQPDYYYSGNFHLIGWVK